MTTTLRWMVGLGVGVLLTACGPSLHRPPRTYAQSVDSASNACARNPALCQPQIGEQFPVVPTGPAVRAPPPLSGAQSAAINAAGAAAVTQVAIEASLESRIRKALSECADEARSRVMLKHFGSRGPTREECNAVVGVDDKGERITRAMQLGNEQHEIALRCVEERLEKLKPGGFSISPRYRIDPDTGRAKYIPREQVEALLNQGRSAELRGTIEPDIVLHMGSPHQVQAVFDFKFPCVNGGTPRWRSYPDGHPYQGLSQKDLYRRFLSDRVFRVIPRQGVLE